MKSDIGGELETRPNTERAHHRLDRIETETQLLREDMNDMHSWMRDLEKRFYDDLDRRNREDRERRSQVSATWRMLFRAFLKGLVWLGFGAAGWAIKEAAGHHE